METSHHHHPPRRRRPPTRGLLFGAPLDRLPSAFEASVGFTPTPRPEPVPIALIGASMPVAPPRVVSFGAMAANWPLVDRAAIGTAEPVLPDRRQVDGGPVGGVERRWGGLSTQEWQHLLGR